MIAASELVAIACATIERKMMVGTARRSHRAASAALRGARWPPLKSSVSRRCRQILSDAAPESTASRSLMSSSGQLWRGHRSDPLSRLRNEARRRSPRLALGNWQELGSREEFLAVVQGVKSAGCPDCPPSPGFPLERLSLAKARRAVE